MPLGNDVIDLTDRTPLHPRFVARVCTVGEIAAIATAADPARLLWAHWAAKESAFKALRQVDPAARFRPRACEVRFRRGMDGETLCGVVAAGGQRFAVDVHCFAGGLHAVARLPGASPLRVAAGVRHIDALAPPPPSELARALAIQSLCERLGWRPEEISIGFAARGLPPPVVLRGVRSNIELSLSHHGRLVAFAHALAPAGRSPE